MRKDVRLGFAVGGVLLAVLIVAVLVIHRNKNPKTVAFDPGKESASAGGGGDSDGIDIASPTAASPKKTADAGASAPPAPRQQPKDATKDESNSDENSQKGGNRWNLLFASTAADPIKSELRAPRPAERNFSPAPDTHDAAAMDSNTDNARPIVRQSQQPAPLEQASAPARPAATVARTHKIQQGETFVTIARTIYGDGKYYKAIQKANPTLNPQRLKPGTVIQLPPASEVKQSSPAKSQAPSASTASGSAQSSDRKTYTVQKDDNLYNIARKLYPGKKDMDGQLYELNKQVIGPDSTKLRPGMVLKLPEPPAASSDR